MAGLTTFVARPIALTAIRWTGSNDATIVANFGAYIANAIPDPNDPTARIVTNTTGTTFTARVGDWLGLDVLNRLIVVDQEQMYKSYNYVSG